MKGYSNYLLKRIKQHLKHGGLIAYPTEHCYGLGCDPLNYKAVNNIIKLKKRNSNKGLIIIASKLQQLSRFVQIEENESQYQGLWPGRVTLLLERNEKNIPQKLIGKHNKVAVRITKHQLVCQLCNYLQMAIVSTSANLSKRKALKTYKSCIKTFGHKVMVLPGLTNFAKQPSKIIDWQTKQQIR